MEKPKKSIVWTKEKINNLIKLYRENECLWNVYHENYKSTSKRNGAVTYICTCLEINKFEFGKKIHNLRNQFNSEMKKLERRLEEAGETNANICGSKWEHFESLKFLKDVIEPRPGSFRPNLIKVESKVFLILLKNKIIITIFKITIILF